MLPQRIAQEREEGGEGGKEGGEEGVSQGLTSIFIAHVYYPLKPALILSSVRPGL
jgi:hypothetical protein